MRRFSQVRVWDPCPFRAGTARSVCDIGFYNSGRPKHGMVLPRLLLILGAHHDLKWTGAPATPQIDGRRGQVPSRNLCGWIILGVHPR
jgi:hypothetical protein